MADFTVSFFNDVTAAEVDERRLSPKDMLRRLRRTSRSTKSELPLLKLALFGDRCTKEKCLRHDANLLAITGVEGDYDAGETSFDDALDILKRAGVSAIAYTTARHDADAPRWRVLCPLSEGYPPGERDRFMGRLADLFDTCGATLAPESWTPSQAYYFGAVDDVPDYRVELIDGEPIDLLDDLDSVAVRRPGGVNGPARPGEPLAAVADIEAALKVISNDNREWDGPGGWNRIGMAVYRASGGSDAGLAAFDRWSAKSAKYDTAETRRRWDHYHRSPPSLLGFGTLVYLARQREQGWLPPGRAGGGVALDDFFAYMPAGNYIFAPTGETWPAKSVNARIAPVVLRDAEGNPRVDKKGLPVLVPAASWLDEHRAVEQMTWVPGEPMVIADRLTNHAGWIERRGVQVFNLYRAPQIEPGNSGEAERWLEHVERVFPDDHAHIVSWLAHRVQHPGDKVNHALVLGGAQGIGKDTLLEPVRQAVGAWNWADIAPSALSEAFNPFARSVILRINEGHDLGDLNRFQFYEAIKVYTASPPEVLRVNDKYIRQFYVPNVCGVIITTNHLRDGIYLPADDRRHFVAWSGLTKEHFKQSYWDRLWRWYKNGGFAHVAAYLAELDISAFDAKAPPQKTEAFWTIVDAGGAPEDAELADAVDKLGKPDAFVLTDLVEIATGEFQSWLVDRKNRRIIPHRLEQCGYVPVRNPDAEDGFWRIDGRRQVSYARAELARRDQIVAVKQRQRDGEEIEKKVVGIREGWEAERRRRR